MDSNQEKSKTFLLPQEKKECRFVCLDQNFRLFECVVHRDKEKGLSHGLRLFPIHLWKLKDGIPYRLIDRKEIAWYDLAEYAQNKKK